MRPSPGFRPAVKIIAFWIGFLLLHYLYEWFPITPLALISGVSEAVFQHAKIVFYTYLILSAVEYGIYARQITHKKDYVFSRLLAVLISPWLMMVLWYIGPALNGAPMPSIPLEIIYANIMMFLLGLSLVTLEKAFSQITFSRGQLVLILALLLVSILHFTVFTFTMPWADVFTPPNY